MLPFVLNGDLITDAINVRLRGNCIDVFTSTGSTATYAYIDTTTAAAYYTGVKQSQNVATGLILGSITPGTFDITATTVTILGSNFVSGATYTLYIDDVPGGFDADGYFMNCTYVSQNILTASFGGPGNSTLASQNYVYLVDTTSRARSTVLMATWPGSGTIITMQQ